MRSSDPFTALPLYPDGSLRGRYFRFVPLHELDEKIKRGWRPVPLTDAISCHHDHNGVFCEAPRPWWRRLRDWIECACGRGMPVPR